MKNAAMSLLLAAILAWCGEVFAEDSPAEIAAWVGAGGGSRETPGGDEAFGEFDVGLDMTFRFALADPFEFRLGPFLNVSLSEGIALGETGLQITFSEDDHAQWGTFDLRAGGGNGLVFGELIPHYVVTATGGIRSFKNRFDSSQDLVSFGSVFRAFGTVRLRPESGFPIDVSFGIELEPTFLLPPYSWSKLAGARPH